MTADASIYGQIKPAAPLQGPLDQYTQVMQLKDLLNQQKLHDLQFQGAQADFNEAQTLRDIFKNNPGASLDDIQKLAMAGGAPNKAIALGKQILENKKLSGDIQKTNVETMASATKQARDTLATINSPEEVPKYIDSLKRSFGPDIAATFPIVQNPPTFASQDEFNKWKQDHLMTADETIKRMSPELKFVNAGGKEVAVNPYTGKQTGADVKKTVSPDALLHAGVQAATADPFGTLGIKSMVQNAGGPVAPSTTPAGVAATNLSGEEFLNTLPKQTADQVKALAEGRMQFPGGFALKSPYWQQMIQAVSQYDPNFDAVNYNSRAATRKAFTSGKESQSLNALNTVMGHLDSLDQAATDLNNTSMPGVNWLVNTVGGQVSPDLKGRLNKFNLTKQAVVDEMERAYRGAGGSQAGIDAWKATLNDADSPEAIKASIQQGVKLLESKIEALGDQYSKGMGTTKSGLELLNPHAQDTFNRLVGNKNNPTQPNQPAKQSQTFDAPPDPAKYNGKTIRGDDGTLYKSNGKNWVRQ